MLLVNVALLWIAVSLLVSLFIGGWLARRPAGLAPAGLGAMTDRGAVAPLDP